MPNPSSLGMTSTPTTPWTMLSPSPQTMTSRKRRSSRPTTFSVRTVMNPLRRTRGPCECDDCYECDERRGNEDDDDSDLINSYGYKPRPIFRGTGPTYLGLELE